MHYQPSGHFTGGTSATHDVTVQIPWLYTIACVRDRIIYIGETHDRSGLISRLGSHFGYYNSSLRQAANKRGGVRSLKSPFIVVAAQLPTDEPAVRFDSSSKPVRLLVEAIVHNRLARFAATNEWTVISSTSSSTVQENGDMIAAGESIADCVQSTLRFVQGLTPTSPFHFVTLTWRTDDDLEYEDLGRVLNRIEVTLCRYVLRVLQDEHASRWWVGGVPQTTRVACAERQEQEAHLVELPKHAYLMLIDLRKIVVANWPLFQDAMQRLSGKSGRDRSTDWIRELNEVRKYWAHPIKQIYSGPMSADLQKRIRTLSIELHALAGAEQGTKVTDSRLILNDALSE